MNDTPILISRRQMLAGTAAALATAALPRLLSGQEPARQRKVCVTIDDGPLTGGPGDAENFTRLCDALRESFLAEKVPGIMFVNERQLQTNGQRDRRVAILRRWLETGLDIGNHTFSHPNLNDMDVWRYTDDIIKGEVVSRPLMQAHGKQLVWFRYPYLASGTGEKAKAVEDFLFQRGYKIAPVTVDYQDYSFNGGYVRHIRAGQTSEADEHFGRMMNALDEAFARAETRSMEILGYELPQILLIHCNETNALTLPTTFKRIRDRGYNFVSLDEAMQDPAYQVPGFRPGALGGGGFFNSLAAVRRQQRTADEAAR